MIEGVDIEPEGSDIGPKNYKLVFLRIRFIITEYKPTCAHWRKFITYVCVIKR